MIVQVFEDFMNESKEQLNKCAEALKNQDYVTIQRELHTIKGNAGTLGVEKLSQQAEFIEKNLKNEDYETLEQDLNFLNLTYQEFEKKYTDLIKEVNDE